MTYEEAIKVLESTVAFTLDEELKGKYNDAKQKAIEALKKQTGHWEICADGYYPYCSICKAEPHSDKMTKYCPNCGADMGIEKEGEK